MFYACTLGKLCLCLYPNQLPAFDNQQNQSGNSQPHQKQCIQHTG